MLENQQWHKSRLWQMILAVNLTLSLWEFHFLLESLFADHLQVWYENRRRHKDFTNPRPAGIAPSIYVTPQPLSAAQPGVNTSSALSQHAVQDSTKDPVPQAEPTSAFSFGFPSRTTPASIISKKKIVGLSTHPVSAAKGLHALAATPASTEHTQLSSRKAHRFGSRTPKPAERARKPRTATQKAALYFSGDQDSQGEVTVKIEKFRSLSSIETRALERGKHRLQDYIVGVEDTMEDIQEEIMETRQKLVGLRRAHDKQEIYHSQLEGRVANIDEKLETGKVTEGTDTFEDC